MQFSALLRKRKVLTVRERMSMAEKSEPKQLTFALVAPPATFSAKIVSMNRITVDSELAKIWDLKEGDILTVKIVSVTRKNEGS